MLDPTAALLAQGPNFAVVTTLMPDGTPQSLPTWVDTDGKHLLVNTEIHRQRYKNLQRDPRVTVLVVDKDDWYSWAEVRGHLVGEVRGPEVREHIDKLSQRYNGADYANPIRTERVILQIEQDHANSTA